VRVALYQRHLSTLGGGERFALDIARHLTARGDDVEVLAPRGTSAEQIHERLGLDVSDLKLVDLDTARPCEEATERSETYDVFVNCSHRSGAVNRARHGVYVCHFPSAHDPRPTIASAIGLDRSGAYAHAAVKPSAGIATDPRGGWWTDGRGWLDVTTAGRAHWTLHLWLAGRHWGWRGARGHVEVRLDGQPLRRLRLLPGGVRRVSVPVSRSARAAGHRVELVSQARRDGMSGRPLGLHIRRARLAAPGVRPGPVGGAPSFLSSYAKVVANSGYTAEWIKREWGREALVVPPSVNPLPRPPDVTRTKSIVVVGRFFRGGHSKRQLELTHAFRRLCEGGVEGWTLDLVGGVEGIEGERYLDSVRKAADGLPVRFLVNATREELARRVGAASILWQAPGWGEDPSAHPDRFEHFGIATVEAMSVGVVPVALAVGGITEIVRDGVDAVLWKVSPEEPTRALIADPDRLRRLSAAARDRARRFAPEAMAERLSAFYPA
jgi:glycosyltransferase involved in cell wall biosynthesis